MNVVYTVGGGGGHKPIHKSYCGPVAKNKHTKTSYIP